MQTIFLGKNDGNWATVYRRFGSAEKVSSIERSIFEKASSTENSRHCTIHRLVSVWLATIVKPLPGRDSLLAIPRLISLLRNDMSLREAVSSLTRLGGKLRNRERIDAKWLHHVRYFPQWRSCNEKIRRDKNRLRLGSVERCVCSLDTKRLNAKS